MAIVTQQIVGFFTPQGELTVLLEYDDVLLRATGVLIDNPSGLPVAITVRRDSDSREYSGSFSNGRTQRQDIPTTVSNRITVTRNSRFRLDGYSAHCAYPA